MNDYITHGMRILAECHDAKEELEAATENFDRLRGGDKYGPNFLAAKHRLHVAKAVMVDREERLYSLGRGERKAS